jgi:SAM-dependent methyltransferase
VSRFAPGTDALVPADPRTVAGVGELVATVETLGLSHLVQFGVGAIVVTDQMCPGTTRPLLVAAVPDTGSRTDRLASLVRHAAENVAWLWMIAEESIRRAGVDLWPAEQYAELAGMFGEEAVYELELRLRAENREEPPRRFTRLDDWGPHELFEWLDGIPGVPLTKELFCCWYPHWWQTGFITDSPFDFIRELPLAADPTLPVVEILELERRGLYRDGELVLPETDRQQLASPPYRGTTCADGARAAAERFRRDGVNALFPLLKPLSTLTSDEAGKLPRLPFSRPDFNRRVLAQQLDQNTDQSSRRLDLIVKQMAWLRDKIGDIEDVLHPMCGPGLFAQALHRVGAQRYVGLDYATATVRHAQAIPQLPRWYSFVQADITDPLSYPSASFGLVINAYESLNCFPPFEGLPLLRIWAERVRPGGHLLIEARLRHAEDGEFYGAIDAWHEPDGSGLDLGDHYLLDESARLADGSAVGHRLVVVPCDRPDRATFFHSLVWLYDFTEISGLLAPLGFTVELFDNPADDSIDTRESLGAKFIVAHRTS